MELSTPSPSPTITTAPSITISKQRYYPLRDEVVTICSAWRVPASLCSSRWMGHRVKVGIWNFRWIVLAELEPISLYGKHLGITRVSRVHNEQQCHGCLQNILLGPGCGESRTISGRVATLTGTARPLDRPIL